MPAKSVVPERYRSLYAEYEANIDQAEFPSAEGYKAAVRRFLIWAERNATSPSDVMTAGGWLSAVEEFIDTREVTRNGRYRYRAILRDCGRRLNFPVR